MKILRVFDKAVMKQKMKNEFISEYLDSVENEDAYGAVQLYSGDEFWFRCVRSMEAVILAQAYNVSCMQRIHVEKQQS